MCVYGARNETREHTMGTKTATTSTTHDNGARRVSVRSQNIEAQLYEARQPHSRSTHTQTQTHRSGRKPKAKRVKRKHAKKSTNTDPRSETIRVECHGEFPFAGEMQRRAGTYDGQTEYTHSPRPHSSSSSNLMNCLRHTHTHGLKNEIPLYKC